MAATKPLIVPSVEELLHELANTAYLKKSKFTPIGAYEEPLKASRRYSLQGRGDVVNDDGVIVNLDFPEQVALLDLISKKHGVSLRHGSLKENLEAAYSPDGEAYKRNVLVPFWVYTGEMIRKLGETHDIGRIKGIEYASQNIPDNHAVFESDVAQPSKLTVIRYNLGPSLQQEVPTNSGHFDKISGVIPVNSEIGSKTGKGYWNSIYSDKGLSAVWCDWISVGQGLYADAAGPLVRNSGGALGMWKDAAVKK